MNTGLRGSGTSGWFAALRPGNFIRTYSLPAILFTAGLFLVLPGRGETNAVSIVAALDGSPLQSYEETVAALPHYNVAGRVVDTNQAPIAGADVFLYYAHGLRGLGDRLAGRTTTDADGRFRIEKALVWEPADAMRRNYETPRYAVIAGHPEQGISFRILLEGDDYENTVITLHGKNTFRSPKAKDDFLRVSDQDGQPVQGAQVFLSWAELPPTEAANAPRNRRYLHLTKDIGLFSRVTDPTGQFERVWIPGAGFDVTKAGYVRTTARGNCTLAPAAAVSGTVTWPDGRPAAGVGVMFEFHGERLFCDEFRVTDAEGRYSFKDVPGKGFRFGGKAVDSSKDTSWRGTLKAVDRRVGTPFTCEKITFDLLPGDTLTNDLRFVRGCVLSGRVLDFTTGEPVPGMQLSHYVRSADSRLSDSQALKTDSQGRFQTMVPPGSQVQMQWEDSRAGDYLIDQDWLRGDNYQPLREDAVTTSRTGLVFKVKLRAVASLTGKVEDAEGRGVSNASVYVESRVPAVTTDAAGAFTLKTAPADRAFDLFAISKDGTLAGLTHLDAGARTATLRLEPTRDYAGEVTTEDGLPAPNLKFYMDLKLNDSNVYRVRVEPLTDASGKFTAKNLCPKARYHVWWGSDNDDNRDYDFGNADVDLATVKEGEPIRFKAKLFLNVIMGRVLNEQKEPIAGAQLALGAGDLLPQNERFNRRSFTTDAEGSFAIDRLAAGTVPIRVSADGYRTKTFNVPTDTVDFEAVLTPRSGEGSLYRATVRDADGTPVPGVSVGFGTMAYAAGGPLTNRMTGVSDSNGCVRFTLPPAIEKLRHGMVLFSCDVPGTNLVFQPAPYDEDTDVELVLEPAGAAWRGRVVNTDEAPITNALVQVTGARNRDGGIEDHVYIGNFLQVLFHSDEEGRFALERFSTGAWINVTIEAEGSATLNQYFDPRRDPGKEKLFRLERAGSIAGSVRVKGAGAGPGEVTVMARAVNGRSDRTVRAMPDGTFEIPGLSPGQYLLDGHCASTNSPRLVCANSVAVQVEPGKRLEAIVEMEEGIPVRGKLLKAGTQEVRAGRKVVYAVSGRRQVGTSEVETDGRWTLYLPEGTIDLYYYIEGMTQQPAKTTITVDRGTPLDGIVLEVK